jgi:carboxylate-amine ligase
MSDFAAKFAFDPSRRFWLGVEEEVWTVNPKTGVLTSGALKVFAKNEKRSWMGCKPELPAQQIEIITPPCATLSDLRRALGRNQATLDAMAGAYGFRISRSPVPLKPFAIDVFPKPRYLKIRDQFGERLRSAYVAGLHIHVGLGSRDEAIHAMNGVRADLPLFLALSARSPVFAGQRTDYASYRFVKYREMAGEIVPPHLNGWKHFEAIAAVRGYLEDPRMCWWAIRISPHGTVELRICDVQENQQTTLGLAALFLMTVRLSVLSEGRSKTRLAPEIIAERLEEAAKGKFDAQGHLGELLRLTNSWPGLFDEERRAIQSYLPH